MKSANTPTSPAPRHRFVPWLAAAIVTIGLGASWLVLRSGVDRVNHHDTTNPSRMPITHPVLEADRPDLLSEPGMQMLEHHSDEDEDHK
jgi:hypothetical protein